jgi:hypothetical protein
MQKWDRKEKLMVVGTVLTLTSILISASLIRTQLRQSNALTWRAAIESQSNDFSRLETITPALSCIYRWNDPDIDDDCTGILKRPANRRLALMHVSEVLDLFHEIDAFSAEYDRKYAEGYRDWVGEISHLDVTAFFLFTSKIDAKQALKDFSITVTDQDIKKGYLRFRQRIGLKDHEK